MHVKLAAAVTLIAFTACAAMPVLPEVEPAVVACADTRPPADVRAQACTAGSPCPTDRGLWMPRDVALDYACNTRCCRDTQARLRGFKCESSMKTALVALSIGALLGFVGGVYVVVKLDDWRKQ